MDDQLWHQAMVTMRCLDEQHRGQALLHHEATLFQLLPTLFQLLQMGAVDAPTLDHPWDASTRAMRYASSVGDCLWELLLEERARLSVWATLPWLELPDTFDREIVLSGPSMTSSPK
jgi:hypothetical protein